MKTKIYISKTNRTNPDDESRVRAVLSDFKDVEIVEYRGGIRNLANVRSCDFLIILPNYIDEFIGPDWGGMSLGQYDEYCSFNKENYSTADGNTFFVTETNQFHVTIRSKRDFDCAESDDTFNHIYVEYKSGEDTLRAILEDRLGYQMGESHFQQSAKSNYHILIS